MKLNERRRATRVADSKTTLDDKITGKKRYRSKKKIENDNLTEYFKESRGAKELSYFAWERKRSALGYFFVRFFYMVSNSHSYLLSPS